MNNIVCKELKEMSVIQSENFQKLFMKESDFRSPQRGRNRAGTGEMKVNGEEIQEILGL